jgi:hypothetical protein
MKGNELNWRKARASSAQNGCVEVGTTAAGDTGTVHVRDTKNRKGGMLTVDAATWRAFIANAKSGTLNLSAFPARS